MIWNKKIMISEVLNMLTRYNAPGFAFNEHSCFDLIDLDLDDAYRTEHKLYYSQATAHYLFRTYAFDAREV